MYPLSWKISNVYFGDYSPSFVLGMSLNSSTSDILLYPVDILLIIAQSESYP